MGNVGIDGTVGIDGIDGIDGSDGSGGSTFAGRAQNRRWTTTRDASVRPRRLPTPAGSTAIGFTCVGTTAVAIVWSPLSESNRRPFPYHGNALPTELRGRLRRTGAANSSSDEMHSG